MEIIKINSPAVIQALRKQKAKDLKAIHNLQKITFFLYGGIFGMLSYELIKNLTVGG